MNRTLALLAALALPATATAQDDPSPWRFGVSIGGGSAIGVLAEYWNDDMGVEARVGTFAFRRLGLRVTPKWRVGQWDGGEVSLRAGIQFYNGGTDAFHGVEIASVTDGGHVWGGSYNLPLFGTRPESDSPDDEDTTLPSSGVIRFATNLVLGELTYRYQP